MANTLSKIVDVAFYLIGLGVMVSVIVVYLLKGSNRSLFFYLLSQTHEPTNTSGVRVNGRWAAT